jgi:hypothetical protein
MSTYTEQLLDRIDQLTQQRDQARAQVARVRALLVEPDLDEYGDEVISPGEITEALDGAG